MMKKLLAALMLVLISGSAFAENENNKARCILIAVKRAVPNVDGVKLMSVKATKSAELTKGKDNTVYIVEMEIGILKHRVKTNRICIWVKHNNSVQLVSG